MQRGYVYYLTEPVGKNFAEDFKPELTPPQMFSLGVFGGVYMRDCNREFPRSWWVKAKLAKDGRDADLNFFKVNASKPLKYWVDRGWINFEHDPRGWFQWYCRYYMGRRIPGYDKIQIKRWKQMVRHIAQLKKNCPRGSFLCRPRQRQALLHWAYDSRKM
ncbi:MAG: hypothetical protein PF542_02160 [Nanoarchaeota archaeon]|nr:hypothetical protein [Nanoarchaeota archaeon]